MALIDRQWRDVNGIEQLDPADDGRSVIASRRILLWRAERDGERRGPGAASARLARIGRIL